MNREMRRWIAWAERRIGRIVISEGLHVGLAQVTQGPLTVTFRLRLLKPSRTALKTLLALGPTFAQSLQVDAVRVTDTARGVLIEAPSPVSRTPTAAMLAKRSSGLSVAVGLDQWRKPARVTLSDHPSLLFVGPTRRGKTQAMKSTLWALAQGLPISRFQYVIFSQKRADWHAFDGAAGCLGIISDPDEAHRVADAVASQVLAERAARGVSSPALVLVFDDLINLLQRAPEIADPMGEIASMGGGVGIYQLIGTQDAGSKRGTGGGNVEANITARVVYRAANASSAARAAGAGGLGIDSLSGHKGDGLLILDGHVTRIATGYADDRLITQLPGGAPVAPWMAMGPVTTGYEAGYEAGDELVISDAHNRLSPVITSDPPPADDVFASQMPHVGAVAFPLGEGRPLNSAERALVRKLARESQYQHAGKPSINRLCAAVYGSKNAERAQWIKSALSEDTSTVDVATEAGRRIALDLLRSGDVSFIAAQ